MDIPVVPGAVLVNVGDLMQRWTSDRFVSSVSRCLDPNLTQKLIIYPGFP